MRCVSKKNTTEAIEIQVIKAEPSPDADSARDGLAKNDQLDITADPGTSRGFSDVKPNEGPSPNIKIQLGLKKGVQNTMLNHNLYNNLNKLSLQNEKSEDAFKTQ